MIRLLLLAALCAAVALLLFKLPPLGTKPDGQRPEKIPLTYADVQLGGGFGKLSPRQQAWVRERYATDLTKFLRIADNRLRAALLRGDGGSAAACQNLMRQLSAGLARVNNPKSDPTAEQQTIIVAVAALGS